MKQINYWFWVQLILLGLTIWEPQIILYNRCIHFQMYIRFIIMMLFFIGTNKLLILGSVDSLNIYCSFGHFNPKMNLFGILSNKMLDSVSISKSNWQVYHSWYLWYHFLWKKSIMNLGSVDSHWINDFNLKINPHFYYHVWATV